MNRILSLLIIVLLGSTSYAQHNHSPDSINSTKKHSISAHYTCPMHPEVTSDKPGKCPKCGMDLVPVESTSESPNSGHSTAHLVAVSKKKYTGGKRKTYHLYVRDTLLTFKGKERRAIAVNGQIPMPTLEFYEGDTAHIVVHNQLKESTSLHWHGLHLPNREDGVPWLTQKPIPPGSSYSYTFPIIQNGTHWYHSHSGMQEQIGMYGMFVMKKHPDDTTIRKGIDDLKTYDLILSEWTNLNPHDIQRMLHHGTDWFGIKKGSTQSYSEAITQGHFFTKLENEWKRMHAMDVSDIHYDAFLSNGKERSQLVPPPHSKIRLRIANAGASSYFWLQYSGGPITVVASDGNDIVPIKVDRMILAVSETVDIILETPPHDKAFELRATAEDRSGSTVLQIGNGSIVPEDPLPKLDYFAGMKMMNSMMKTSGEMKDMGMHMQYQSMDMNEVMYPELKDSSNRASEGHSEHTNHADHKMKMPDGIKTLQYAMMKSPFDTRLQDSTNVRDITFTLTGNMNRYVWSMNDKVLSESDKIPVKKGEILRVTLVNNSMMRHPMHLHGFDFRVLNSHGAQAPLKNVLDVMPMERNTIEFEANQEGDWFFHCHILYHMMAGMNRVFSVGSYSNPLLPNPQKAYSILQRESNMWHLFAENDFATNGNDGRALLSNARWEVGSEWRLGYNSSHGYEFEAHLGRYVDRMQWLKPFIAFNYHYRKRDSLLPEKNLFGQSSTKDERHTMSAGVVYTLPLLVNLQAEVFTDGIFRVRLSREDIPLTPRIRGAFMVNSDKEYMAGLKYIVHKNVALSTHYDSDMKWGAGITLIY